MESAMHLCLHRDVVLMVAEAMSTACCWRDSIRSSSRSSALFVSLFSSIKKSPFLR